MALRARNPNILSLILLSLLAIASAKVYFEERFEGISLSFSLCAYSFLFWDLLFWHCSSLAYQCMRVFEVTCAYIDVDLYAICPGSEFCVNLLFDLLVRESEIVWI